MTQSELDYVNPMDNPTAANAAVAAALSSGPSAEIPTIDPPADDVVALPGGMVDRKGNLIATTVQVRELTGADEEALDKARRSNNFARFLSTLLQVGTAKIGDQKATPALVKDLLIGDRDAVILGIRRATYGDDIEVKDFRCPECGEFLDLTITLDDIPTRSLKDRVADRYFEVSLRKGGHAKMRLPDGHDQELVLDEKLNDAERITLLLSKCVISLVDKDGEEDVVLGSRDRAAAIGLADRRKMVKEISDRQPGPQYDDIKFTHESCGKEVPIPLGVGDLFRDL